MGRWHVHLLVLAGAAALLQQSLAQDGQRRWLAGDSHIHSHWSPGYDRTTQPPTPVRGGDARYSTIANALKAQQYGLRWMVTTDHGGPNHAKLNLEHAYAELRQSRAQVPGVLQFYGLELNMPAMDHHTLIIPHSAEEASTLLEIERRFDRNEVWPADPSRNTEEMARRALQYMAALPRLPLLLANHPSRSATGLGRYGLDEPREFRAHHDQAPGVYRGMEGAPGHQAAALAPDGSPKRTAAGRPAGFRGAYANPGAHTLGGFDQMTAVVGGLWDSLLGEGRRFWIVATSDSHVHYAEADRPGSDFWPGEYQKTYVHADPTYDGVLDGLRSGRIFVVAGDLIAELDITARAGTGRAGMGETLTAAAGQDVQIDVRFRDPETPNARGDTPRVARVDVIAGEVSGPSPDRNADRNPSTRVIARVGERDWTRRGDVVTFTVTLPRPTRDMYIRIRGTSTQDAEPGMDVAGENPWQDLWFYTNPVFVTLARPPAR